MAMRIARDSSTSKDTAKLMSIKLAPESKGAERREHRRYELGGQTLQVNRWNTQRREALDFGHLVDVSAGGVRVRTSDAGVRADHQIRVRLEMPSYAGICPFIEATGTAPKPKTEWVGWLAVSRVQKLGDGTYDVAGRLIDMDEMDRGMLGLYLSTQPLAA